MGHEIEEIYLKYRANVYNYLYQLSLNKHTAEELTQDTFLKVFKYFNSFKSQSSVKTWLFKIARNTYLNHNKKKCLYNEETIEGKVLVNVEDHLKECDKCKAIYESEIEFEENLLNSLKQTPSDKVDEGLFLKLKIKRFKIGIAMGLIIILLVCSSVGFSSYFNNSYNKYIYGRKLLQRDIRYAEGKITELNFDINYVKEDKLEVLLQDTFTSMVRIDGHYKNEKDIVAIGKRQGSDEFNYLKENSMNINIIERVIDDVNSGGAMFSDDINKREEKVFYSMYQNSNFPIDIGLDLSDMVKYLQEKYVSGKWDSKDEEVFTTLKKYLINFLSILENEDKKLQAIIVDGHYPIIIRGYNSVFKPTDVNVASISTIDKQLVDFVTNYCKANKIGYQ